MLHTHRTCDARGLLNTICGKSHSGADLANRAPGFFFPYSIPTYVRLV